MSADFSRRHDQIEKTLELGNNILANAHSDAIGHLKQSIGALSAGWNELQDWMDQLANRIKMIENEEVINKQKLDKLLDWLLNVQGEL